MDGQIAQLIGSDSEEERRIVQDVFGSGFHTMGQWRSFLRCALNANTSSMLSAPSGKWSVKSFHALYIACWIHHPVEKGTFMIDLGGLSEQQRGVVKDAYEKRLYGRKSSHLSGSGRSASRGWAFLNGYHELLVQYELTRGRPFLLLKAEGHTTSIKQVGPHLKSYWHKRKHGEGLTASPNLHNLANSDGRIEGRAAENYGTGYKKMLKNVLGFKGRQVTVREAMAALFPYVGYHRYTPNQVIYANNSELGICIQTYISDATQVGNNGLSYRAQAGDDYGITADMISDLRKLSITLINDGAVTMPRVFREVRVKPSEIDASLDNFYNTEGT